MTEATTKKIPNWLFDLIVSGDLEPILQAAEKENWRINFYNLRRELEKEIYAWR